MFNLRIVKDYLKHRLKAKTRHGLHSPFVYRLVDEVVYDFSQKKVYSEIEKLGIAANQPTRVKKLNRLIYRIINDRQPKNITFLGHTSPVTDLYIKAASPASFSYDIDGSTNPGVIFIDTKNEAGARGYFNNCLKKADAHTLIILKNIHFTDGMSKLWDEIKANPKVTVTVDLFLLGLVYFRKGQAREDFWIRF